MRFGPLSFWILLALFLFSCGKGSQKQTSLGNGDLRWNSFPVVIHASAQIHNDSNATQDLQDAMDFWAHLAGKQLFQYEGEWNGSMPPYAGPAADPTALYGNVIFFQNPWPFDLSNAANTTVFGENNFITNAEIFLNPNTSLCSADCPGQTTQTSRRKLLAHELGHMLGFNHTDDPSNIMNSQITFGGSLSGITADMEILKKLTN